MRDDDQLPTSVPAPAPDEAATQSWWVRKRLAEQPDPDAVDAAPERLVG